MSPPTNMSSGWLAEMRPVPSDRVSAIRSGGTTNCTVAPDVAAAAPPGTSCDAAVATAAPPIPAKNQRRDSSPMGRPSLGHGARRTPTYAVDACRAGSAVRCRSIPPKRETGSDGHVLEPLERTEPPVDRGRGGRRDGAEDRHAHRLE